MTFFRTYQSLSFSITRIRQIINAVTGKRMEKKKKEQENQLCAVLCKAFNWSLEYLVFPLLVSVSLGHQTILTSLEIFSPASVQTL